MKNSLVEREVRKSHKSAIGRIRHVHGHDSDLPCYTSSTSSVRSTPVLHPTRAGGGSAMGITLAVLKKLNERKKIPPPKTKTKPQLDHSLSSA